MAQKEIVSVLKVETGQSENTIKALKKEIADLKKTLESAEIGSEGFEKASKELATAQGQLKSIMAQTKQTVNATEGSYDALVATMSKLKKEWRSTADEAKRNEIGKQIEAINTELKELDATLGNHQRNVGNYKGDIIDAYREIQGETKKTNSTLAGATDATYDYGKAWGEVQKSTEQTRAKFESVQKVASGLASGFAAVQGAAALFGLENENLEKTLVKVQAAMAIAQGVGGLKDLIEGFSQAKTAFMGASMGLKAMTADSTVATAAMNGTTIATNTATVATNNFKRALIATGIGAIVVLIGTLIANLDKLAKALGFAKEEQKEVNEEIQKSIERENERKKSVNDSVGSILGKYKLLQRQWKELSSVEEKNEWIKKNKQAFDDLGLSINGVNDAQKAFVEFSDEVIKAIKDQARARAMAKLYEEAIAQQYTAQQELEDAQTTADEKYKSGYVPTDEEMEQVGITGKEYKHIDWGPLDYWKETGAVNKSGAATLKSNYLSPFQEKVDIINGEVTKIEEAFVEAEETAAASAAAVQGLVTPSGGGSGSGSGGGLNVVDADLERIKNIQERVAEYLEETRKSLIDTRQEELDEQERIYTEEKLFLEKKGIDTENLVEENRLKVAEINKKWDDKEKEEREKTANDLMSLLNDELYNISYNSSIKSDTVEIGYATKSINLDENDAVGAIQLEIDKTLELQAIREQAFNDQMAQIKAVLDAELENDILTSEQEAELQAQYNALQQEKILVTADANNQISALNKQLVQEQKADNRELAKNITSTFTSALNAASSIISAVQEGIDTTNKEGFEKNKKLQIANATISMLVGITNAMAGAYTSKTGPWDWILAGIQAAAIATTGAIQISNIKKQTFDGSGGGNVGNLNGVGVTPNVSMSDMIPINYTKELMTDTETTEMNKGNRVYVVESDISDTQRNVEVKESNSSF